MVSPFVRAKTLVAKAVCQPSIGRLAAWFFAGVIPHRGCRIDTLDAAIPDVLRASLFWGLYESAEVRLLKKHLPADKDVLDLGTSIGVVAAHAARHLAADRKLICVEANRSLLAVASRNVARNGPPRDFRIVHGALAYGGQPLASFLVAANTLASALAAPISTGPLAHVPAVTLARLLADSAIAGDFTLLCDVEGAEAPMIRYDKTTLRRCHSMIIELHDSRIGDEVLSVAQLLSEIQSLGFSLLERQGPVCAFRRLQPY